MADFTKEGEGRRDYGHTGEKTSEGRVLRSRRPRIASGGSQGGSEKVNYESHRSYGDGERRSFGGGERRSFGGNRGGFGQRRNFDRPGYNADRNSESSERSFGGERRSFSGERRSFGDGERRNFGGERRSFGGNRGGFGQRRNFDRPGYNADRNSESGEHGFGGERRSFGGERRSFGDGERRNFGGERRSFGGNRGSFGQRRNFDRPGYNADRNSESGERSFGGERRSFGGERRGFGGGERRPFGGNRGGFGQNRDDRKPFAKAGRKPFRKSEFSFNERDEESINRLLSGKPQLDNMELPEGGVAEPLAKDEVRLNKFIANSGVCSRREADTFIQAGVVTVNGETVTELGTKVNIFNDDVRFNGERLKGEEKVYIVMNKPKGFVTTASDPHAEKTVMDLLKGCKSRVFPVGRLDKATTGVLMFTNDGEIAERLTHPSYDKKKIYQVILDHPVTQEDFDKVLAGVTLTDGDVAADELEYIDENDKRKLGIEIHSGKNRIVRRIFESLGYDVRALDRVYFAGLTKKGLKKGEWRYLSEQEANILKMGAYV